jgi:hypothetical protein
MLKETYEREFIWSLVTLNKTDANRYFRKISNHENTIKYCIENRLDSFLVDFLGINFIKKNVDKSTFNEIKKTTSFKNYRSLMAIDFASKISRGLIEKNINHVFLKGIGNLNFKNNYIHPMKDIDLLVNEKDINKVIVLAQDLGFFFCDGIYRQSIEITEDPDIYDIPIMKNDADIFLEIHYKIIIGEKSKTCKLSSRMLRKSITRNVFGRNFICPSNEDLFLHYIYHGIKKGNFNAGPGAILIIFIILNFRNIDLKKVENLAHKTNLDNEFKLVKFIINNENSSHGVYEKIKKIYLQPVLNRKISLMLKKNDYSRLIYLIKNIFVSKEKIKREFSITEFYQYHYFLYITRWYRQIYLLLKERKNIKEGISLKKRHKIIAEINKELNGY